MRHMTSTHRDSTCLRLRCARIKGTRIKKKKTTTLKKCEVSTIEERILKYVLTSTIKIKIAFGNC